MQFPAMNRRSFLTASGSTILVSTLPYAFATESITTSSKNNSTTIIQSKNIIDPGLSRRQWKTIIAVQDHLFPSNIKSAAPGAKDVNAKAYFYAVLSDADRDDEDRKLVKNGLIELQDICWKNHQKLFVNLTLKQREKSLRILEQTANGTPWIMTVLGYVFEALLVDPVYGGNPDGIGWKWLDHQAGLPRPPTDKRYFLL
ncbi:MAG: gluconate 2-dehydrogenase subunit 3 family protein [Pseudomonadota bacterium]